MTELKDMLTEAQNALLESEIEKIKAECRLELAKKDYYIADLQISLQNAEAKIKELQEFNGSYRFLDDGEGLYTKDDVK